MNDLYKRLNNLSEAQQAFILSGVFAGSEKRVLHVDLINNIERKVTFFEEDHHELSKR